jgi:hypothetical protein
LSSFVVADINDDIQRKQAQDRRELELTTDTPTKNKRNELL